MCCFQEVHFSCTYQQWSNYIKLCLRMWLIVRLIFSRVNDDCEFSAHTYQSIRNWSQEGVDSFDSFFEFKFEEMDFFFIFLVPVNGRKLPSGRGGVKSFLPRCPKSIQGNRASLCPSSAAAAGHQIFGYCFFGQTNTVAQLALSLQKSSRTRVAVYNPFLIWEVKWTSEGCPSFNLTQAPPHHNS